MKIKIPCFARATGGREVLCVVLLKGFEKFVIGCEDREQIWGSVGLYAKSFLLTFMTEDLHQSQTQFGNMNMLVYGDIINIDFFTEEKANEYLVENYYLVKDRR